MMTAASLPSAVMRSVTSAHQQSSAAEAGLLWLIVSLSVSSEQPRSVSVCGIVSSDKPCLPASGSGDPATTGDLTDPEPATAGQY